METLLPLITLPLVLYITKFFIIVNLPDSYLIDSAYRKPESEATLPRIPVQPIGYKEAEELLK